jgi:glucuronokinase
MRTLSGYECGVYEPLDPRLLPPVYLAYPESISKPTQMPHSRLRVRYDQGDPKVMEAIRALADLTDTARQYLRDGNWKSFHPLIDQNFEIRRSIQPIAKNQLDLVLQARKVGATAKFAGSGGAIIGTYADEDMLDELRRQLGSIGCRVITPQFLPDPT